MQSSSSANRKRPAPGTTPMTQQPLDTSAYDFTQVPTDFSNYDFSTDSFTQPDVTYADTSYNDSNAFASGLNNNNTQYPAFSSNIAAQPTSTELVRRTRNQQLAARNGQQEQWSEYPASGQTDDEDEQELERKIASAKRDAQGKRKQIPPFVQKLSSFLDSGNTDLIRWSDDGRSFIVIDEDEFARTLIPELFKHNNYASFVRQLNMYGFHKTVNITDGSLRQSEKARKGVKPPSMYSHPYFRRNRPDLLWLIQKPSTKASAKRKRDGTTKGEFDSDEERQGSPGPETKPLAELNRTVSQDLVTMPKSELAHVRRELIELRRSQKYIRDVIEGLKKQNDQFYRQATQFQDLHQRHENSINAILTFLATFYNRSLDGHAGQNLVNMFTNATQQAQPQGSVVEDLNDTSPDTNTTVQRYRKPPLLLPPPASASVPQTGSVRATPARSSVSPLPQNDTADRATTASPLVKNETLTPSMQNLPENDQMMSLINTVNANSPGSTTPNLDFSAALNHYQNANGNAPLTTQQRNDVLSMMANQQNNGGNNALISPTPPSMPDLNQFKETQQQLEMLQNMQKAQDEKVQELNRRLQPLSPTGAIPGVGPDTEGAQYFDPTGAPGDFDPNSFLNFDGDGDVDFNCRHHRHRQRRRALGLR
ncbi:hypothetical protein AMS68_004540 [Peltaster fructicola]|uniref:HSF-type DNA-binding domain-containing protein n=1 Tax=Peltaster fructicola TaxID=286661 RepID=A0A6H0XW95_9PEZI|nr:hypothetical protein AMS68_004540 [Peltaster fructicola]